MARFALVLLALGLALVGPAAAQDSFGGAVPQPQKDGQQQQGFGQQQGFSEQQGSSAGGTSDQGPLEAAERQDFGVAPVSTLHAGAMHGPTPASIPGGQLITTRGLVELVQGRQMPFILLDILGGPEMIPGAVPAVPAHQPGDFNDETQQAFGSYLQQATGGNPETPLVFYCLSTQCWMSYNAALRAINLGYRNVLWYRGGIEAWKAAGQQTQPNRSGY